MGVDDQIAKWQADDQRWVSENQDLIQIVFNLFVRTGEWPSVTDLQRRLAQSGVRSIKVQEAIDSQPLVPGQHAFAHRDHVSLRIRHLLNLQSARPMLSFVVATTMAAVTAYLTPGVDQPAVSRSDVAHHPTVEDDHLLERVPTLMSSDPPNVLGGGQYSGDWRIFVNPNTVLDFETAASPEEYVACQEQIIRRNVARHPGQLRPTEPTHFDVFVLMPFSVSWSLDSYAFMKGAAARLGDNVNLFRADDIVDPGRITEQVVESIENANALVADITGLNPNVMWELGFAHAHKKAVVLITQTIGDAPFDLLDYRQVSYELPPKPSQEELLTSSIAVALGLKPI